MVDEVVKAELAAPGRGRMATEPVAIPPSGWKDIAIRTWKSMASDRVTLVAAGVTYYFLLALFPTLAALVSLYGLFTDSLTVAKQVGAVAAYVPADFASIIKEQLFVLTQQGATTLGWGFVIAFAIAIWSASNGVKTMFEAMNIAYHEVEKRNFFVLNGFALLVMLAMLLVGIVMISVVVVLPAALSLIGLATGFEWLAQGAAYLLLIGVLLTGIAALYRFGPSRQTARWRWVTPGAVLAVVGIVAVSVLFSWYSANFAHYEKTYGSLGALIGLLTWMWISVTVVIVGAELNSEIEHQTAQDSTTGPAAPMGERGATMADTVGKTFSRAAASAEDRPDALTQSTGNRGST
jgi:membrane protein